MNRALTQFWIAFLAVAFLGVATLIAVIGDVIFDAESDLTLLLVGGLVASVGQATAYMFRLNGQSGGN